MRNTKNERKGLCMSGFSLESEFYCCKCGTKGIPIARKKGKAREAGHLKKLYCLKCGKETNHAECKEFTHYSKTDFEFERQYGNFDENQNRILDYGLFRNKMHNEGVDLP